MISQLSAKYQFGAMHTADTTGGKVTNLALLSTDSEKVHRLYSLLSVDRTHHRVVLLCRCRRHHRRCRAPRCASTAQATGTLRPTRTAAQQ